MRNKDRMTINGEEYVKASSLAETDGYMLDNFHIILHRKNIEVKGKKCFLCGKDFIGKIKELEGHHALPRKLQSKYNIFIPLCQPCHKRFNIFISEKK